MGFFLRENKQMLFIYSNESIFGTECLEIIESLDLPIRPININKDKLSSIVWMEISAILKRNLGELFSLNYSLIEEDLDLTNFVVADWLELINKYPSMLKYPIAINESKALRILEKNNIFEFYNKLDSEGSSNNVSLYKNQITDSSLNRAV